MTEEKEYAAKDTIRDRRSWKDRHRMRQRPMQVLDALNDLKDAKGVTVADLQTGMKELSREAIEALAKGERE